MASSKPIFRELNADDPDPEVTEIESLCMNCHENGMTRLLLTRIPFYKEVVLMSFSCEKCGLENNELQSGAEISLEGIRITLKVEKPSDLNRQLVKSDTTSVKIVEIDFEVPARTQKGEVTTIESIINRSIAGLEQDQTARRVDHPETAAQIDAFVARFRELKEVKSPFTFILEDISGNSFIENPNAPQTDHNCKTEYFRRTNEQDHELGIFTHEEVGTKEETGFLEPIAEGEFTLEDLHGEVLQFPTNCSNCASPCTTNMKLTNIPHFKDVLIMATNCDSCGHKTNEVKSGGGIEPRGVRIEVEVRSRADFSRDLLKSDTCELKIPELDLEVGPHAIGGRFTTVEGLLVAVRDQLGDAKNSRMFGDSQTGDSKSNFATFFEKFKQVLDAKLKCTLVLDDPAGNSYVQSMTDDDKPDDNMRIVHYERNFEQNEELGLNDIKTENY